MPQHYSAGASLRCYSHFLTNVARIPIRAAPAGSGAVQVEPASTCCVSCTGKDGASWEALLPRRLKGEGGFGQEGGQHCGVREHAGNGGPDVVNSVAEG